MMRAATLEEILRLNEGLSSEHKYNGRELTGMFAGYDELLVMEHEKAGMAVVGVRLDGNDVTCGSMCMGYFNEEEVLDAFIGFAKVHHAGKVLHVCASRDESMAYEVLRYHDFIVDQIETELDEDENETEFIFCSKQL